MKEVNKLRLLAGLPIRVDLELRKDESKPQINEARKIPNGRKELAGRSKKNMVAKVGQIKAAVKHLEAAQESLDSIPATDYGKDIPAAMDSIEDLVDGEGGLRDVIKNFEDEYNVWDRQQRAKMAHRQQKKTEEEEVRINTDLVPESKEEPKENVEERAMTDMMLRAMGDDPAEIAKKQAEAKANRKKSKKNKITQYVRSMRRMRKDDTGRTRTTESMHYNTDNNYPASHETKDDPINVAKNQDDLYYKTGKEFDESPNQLQNNPYNESQKVTVPAKIKSALKTQIDEARKDSKRFKLNRDYDSYNFYNDLANAFENLLEKISKGTVYSLKEAQIFMTSLMGPMLHKIPDDVIKFVANGGVTRSLKGYMIDVSKEYPVTGEPFKNPGEK